MLAVYFSVFEGGLINSVAHQGWSKWVKALQGEGFEDAPTYLALGSTAWQYFNNYCSFEHKFQPNYMLKCIHFLCIIKVNFELRLTVL